MIISFDKRFRRILWIFLLAFPHLKPASISVMWPGIGRIYDIGRILSIVIIVISIIIKKKVKLKPVLIMIIGMELWITLVTLIHGSQSDTTNLVAMASGIAMPLLMYCFSDHVDELTSAIFYNYEWMIYASLLSVFLYYPNGMYFSTEIGRGHYFLGNENGIIFYVLPAFALAMIYIKKEHRFLRGALLIAACLANEIIVWCATGIVGLTVAFLLVLIAYIKKKPLNYNSILIGCLIANILISVVRILDRFWITAYLIDKVLGKTLTLSGRTIIWDAAMPVISSSLVTGLGRGNHIITSYYPRHAHNEYFQILTVGGIPLLILLLFIMIYYRKIFKKAKQRTYATTVMISMLTCLYIQFITTSRVNIEMYVPLALASFSYEIDETIEKRQIRHKSL